VLLTEFSDDDEVARSASSSILSTTKVGSAVFRFD